MGGSEPTRADTLAGRAVGPMAEGAPGAAGDLGVHGVRRQIDLTGPRNRAAINEDLLEKLRIRQRQLPLDGRQGAHLDGGFELTVPGMKMWRRRVPAVRILPAAVESRRLRGRYLLGTTQPGPG